MSTTTTPFDLILCSAHVYVPITTARHNNGAVVEPRSLCIGIRGGKIAQILPWDSRSPPPLEMMTTTAGHETILLPDDCVLFPGLVDSHVHLNEPGRTEWEGFRSGTQAAAAGGTTTIADM